MLLPVCPRNVWGRRHVDTIGQAVRVGACTRCAASRSRNANAAHSRPPQSAPNRVSHPRQLADSTHAVARRLGIVDLADFVSRQQRDRVLGTCDHAHATGLARVGMRRVGNALAMHPKLHTCERRQSAIGSRIDRTHLEYAVRADLNAVALAFTALKVHDRHERSRLGRALHAGSLRVRRGTPRLLGILRGSASHAPARCSWQSRDPGVCPCASPPCCRSSFASSARTIPDRDEQQRTTSIRVVASPRCARAMTHRTFMAGTPPNKAVVRSTRVCVEPVL